MLFTAIFLGLLVSGWLASAFIPWLVLSVATRGNAGLWNLPLALLAGLVCALAVPLLGMTGALGLWISFPMALVASSLLLAARRFSMGAASERRAAASQPVEEVHK